MYSVGVVSLGCSKNRVDTELMLGILRKAGYRITADEREADILIVNTCGFIEPAKQESIDTLLSLARYKQEGKLKLLAATGCDGVMIARGALGDPWLFERVNAALEGLPAPKEPNLQARMNALRRQVEEMVEQKGEFVAMPQARAQTMHYMKGLKGAAALRRYCCTLTHLEDLDELIAAVFEEQRKAGLDPDDVREVPFP